jgi:hypothetical protein
LGTKRIGQLVNWKWDEMVEEFRSLGGIAENVTLKTGPNGRGLFAIDPTLPVTIHVPENLLIRSADIAFEGGKFHVKTKQRGRESEEAFIENFENEFSWGGGGREDAAQKLRLRSELPESARKLLVTEFGLTNFFCEANDAAIEDTFLKSRRIRYKNQPVFMSILELVNHGVDSAGFHSENGISLTGLFGEEVRVQYANSDPMEVFFNWGFPSAQYVALSLQLQLKFGSHRFVIGRNVAQRETRGDYSVPNVRTTENEISFSYLMLGHTKFPRLAKGIFYRLMHDLKVPDAEELFDRIHNINAMQFFRLLAALEEGEGAAVRDLRRVVRYQLEALTQCIGTRQL